MINILITGVNSYIGNSFRNYIEKEYADEYRIKGISCRNGAWKDADFSGYDCLFHVAGIAHADAGTITSEQERKYYEVNRDLTAAVAEKAKQEGVGQFIFMSSSIVYGDSAPIGDKKIINASTVPVPARAYGNSKLQAEKALLALADDSFRVVILRPPMIYGKGSKGNYPVLAKLALKLPFFPEVHNTRSCLYVGNLVEFVRLMIKNKETGIFYPQDGEYFNTTDLSVMIAATHGKKLTVIPGTEWMLKALSLFTPLVNKAFGSFCYEMSLSTYKENYRIYSRQQAIKLTENE